MNMDLGAAALVGVAIASVAASVLALFVIRRWSDQPALARAKSQAQAHLLEFRLFMDDPPTLLRSQHALLRDNLRIMGLLAPALLILVVPMAILLWQLDAFYGRAPLRIGESAVISAESRQDSIDIPAGIDVETKPVHVRWTGGTSWRVRPTRGVSGMVRVGTAERRIVAGRGIAYLPEPLMNRNGVEITYPRATIFGWNWLVWFLVFSAAAAFALRRPLRVAF